MGDGRIAWVGTIFRYLASQGDRIDNREIVGKRISCGLRLNADRGGAFPPTGGFANQAPYDQGNGQSQGRGKSGQRPRKEDLVADKWAATST